MAVKYFGEVSNEDTGAAVAPTATDQFTSGYIWGCKALTFACPGTGAQNVASLGVYVYNTYGDRNFRLAVYSASDSLVAECVVTTPSITNTDTWVETTAITQYATLTGGASYKLEMLPEQDGTYVEYVSVSSGDMGLAAQSYGAYPSTLPALANYTHMPILRCGVEPAATGKPVFAYAQQ